MKNFSVQAGHTGPGGAEREKKVSYDMDGVSNTVRFLFLNMF